jgi:hypothetical protein
MSENPQRAMERRPEPEDLPESELPPEVVELRRVIAEVRSLMDRLAQRNPVQAAE